MSMQNIEQKITVRDGKINGSCVPEDIKDLFYAYIDSSYSSPSCIIDSYRFIKKFLLHRIPETPSDFSDETFVSDASLVTENPNDRHMPGELKRFYSYLLDIMPENFDILSHRIINSNSTITHICNGFRLVKHNVNDKVPEYDKWLLIESEKVFTFDFEPIIGSNLRRLLETYIWYEQKPTMSTKHSRIGYLTAFCNYLEDTDPVVITYSTTLQYKDKISENAKEASSAFVIMNGIKDFIRFLDVSNHLDTKNSYIEDAMKMTNVNSVPFTETYTAEETEAIIRSLSEKYKKESDLLLRNYYQLNCIFVLYILNTAIRAADLIDLRVDSLHQSPGGTYYYLAKSKTKTEEKYEITSDVKALHDEIIEMTKDIRDDSAESSYLFVYKRSRGKTVQRLSQNSLFKEINNAAETAGVRKLGIAGIRNRFMNNITNVILKRGGDPSALVAGVSKHSAAVNYESYFSGNLVQVCREMYGVTIGNTELKAIVTFTNPDATKTNEVLNGRGHCSLATCTEKTKLDCLMCRHCVVTPASIPYFLIEINELNERITHANLPEEKEFAIAMKTLNVAYLAKCYEVSANHGGDDDAKSDQH